ncbi:hypothetical protein ATANTOWER_016900 [Ataeniobius toweri]|uniref:Uncharacterized protein n=1 Tax=Ataeniobius toweri TaxID=208326 RepID=A0ABU7BZY9_9TELE|nr:hypothetical protein [Ataeniobius toweri]
MASRGTSVDESLSSTWLTGPQLLWEWEIQLSAKENIQFNSVYLYSANSQHVISRHFTKVGYITISPNIAHSEGDPEGRKVQSSERSTQIGDIVMDKDDMQPRSQWKLDTEKQ